MTEETIDVERMLLGIDDEDAKVIKWTKCSENMPPDDEQYKIIFKEISSGRSEIDLS